MYKKHVNVCRIPYSPIPSLLQCFPLPPWLLHYSRTLLLLLLSFTHTRTSLSPHLLPGLLPKKLPWGDGGDREFNPQSGYKVKVNQKPFLHSFYARKKETWPHLTAVIVFPPHWNPSSFSDRCFATQSPSLSRSYHFPWIKDGSTRAHACFSTFFHQKTCFRCLFHREGQASTRMSVSLLKMHISFFLFLGKLCPPVALILLEVINLEKEIKFHRLPPPNGKAYKYCRLS